MTPQIPSGPLLLTHFRSPTLVKSAENIALFTVHSLLSWVCCSSVTEVTHCLVLQGRLVKRLADSSVEMEQLTKKLNRLTCVLIVLTALAVLVPVGVEIWHAYLELTAPLPPLVIRNAPIVM